MRAAVFLGLLGFLLGGSAGGNVATPLEAVKPGGAPGEAASPPVRRDEGERLFQANCAICHSAGTLYPGYVHLQQKGAKQPALSRRDDLNAEYIKQVVRMGIGAMPAFTPTHVSNAELDKIAAWLAGKKA